MDASSREEAAHGYFAAIDDFLEAIDLLLTFFTFSQLSLLNHRFQKKTRGNQLSRPHGRLTSELIE